MNSLKCLPIFNLVYNEVNIEIDYNEVTSLIKCQSSSGLFETNFRYKLLQQSLNYIFINSNKITINIDDYITFIPDIQISNLNIFIIIWYITDTSDFAELQALSPKLLKATLKCDHFPEKYYNSNEITLVNNEKYLGYIIPTSLLKFDDFIDIFKDNVTSKLDKLNHKLINWSHINTKSYNNLTLYWENFHPGSKIIIEYINFNHAIIENGTFATKYIR